MNGAGRIK